MTNEYGKSGSWPCPAVRGLVLRVEPLEPAARDKPADAARERSAALELGERVRIRDDRRRRHGHRHDDGWDGAVERVRERLELADEAEVRADNAPACADESNGVRSVQVSGMDEVRGDDGRTPAAGTD
jgi:hypothetical protein